MIYGIILFSIPLVSFIVKKIRKSENLIVIYSFIIFFLISILRDESVGADTTQYIYHFNKINQLGFPTFSYLDMEPGYVLLNSIIGFIDPNPRFLLFVIAFIVIGGYSIFIKNNSLDITFSFMLFLCLGNFFSSLNIYRQSISMVIVLLGYRYIKERKFMHFLFMNILAIMFHKTAICFFPIYFLYHKKIRYIYIIGLICIGLIVFLSFDSIIPYFLNDSYVAYNGDLSGKGYNMLIFNLTLLVGILIIKIISNPSILNKLGLIEEYNLLIYIMILLLVTQILATKFSLLSRVNMYYTSMLIILLPNFLTLIRDKANLFLIKGVILLMYIVLFFTNIMQDLNKVVPYILNF